MAGKAPADWLALRSSAFYQQQRIDLRLATQVTHIDTAQRQLQLDDGSQLSYGALLLATGAEPIRLDIPGADLPHGHCLRTQADSQALVDAAPTCRNAAMP
ncbi:FAD-dependent oxidoreductase [Simplicispira psychrophila]|uniref:FAD-dependent oxidoreductase n=1 Tax=Simplicispira psychrophila TaxID=80882 RepID=UPI000481885B|nr:FAD-dependent oxidoreductase [Simplicispira psychrophila]